ncbi:Retrovirus-related Pol polyprotein from transposon TNT 1-94 [Apostasia shenzhenica]|uniref:Retrovirus-related Pol polyprotein from transposon TNT 1-94 n=1 Tax=Apostasia shenzhenica TaxID=1088818 RepID=A0A2I0AV77_9ASPA|nr:Retrovirus-related Pol polyprotein from transposon TNT 1-94 [Apostasia shenzhenica]
MYAMICTRPDLSHSVSIVSRYMTNSGKEHWNALKWILHYLKGTSDYGLLFEKNSNSDFLIGYVDSNYVGDLDKRRSTTGFIFTLGGGSISWKATLQNIVALSTTKTEYIATVEAAK